MATDKTVVISIRIPVADKAELEAMAKKSDKTLNRFMSDWVHRRLEEKRGDQTSRRPR